MAPGEVFASSIQDAIARVTEEGQEERREILARVSRDFVNRARAVESSVVVGHPADEIVRTAAGPDVGLVVVGARGLGRFKRLILGSVSERVLHHTACPVLVVK
jgi:nucleotide-binding universal stress UspA family protein